MALSLKLIFTPFWHSAPKGVVVAPQILDFLAKNHPKFSLPSINFLTRASPRDIIQLTLKFEDTFGTTQKKTVVAATVFFLFSKKTQVNACRVCFECAELTNQQLLL